MFPISIIEAIIKKSSPNNKTDPIQMVCIPPVPCIDTPMVTIPLIISQPITTGTMGAFWFNPTETFVDMEDNPQFGDGNGKWG
jgi:hypothetical protein